jgi:hypothetical protein
MRNSRWKIIYIHNEPSIFVSRHSKLYKVTTNWWQSEQTKLISQNNNNAKQTTVVWLFCMYIQYTFLWAIQGRGSRALGRLPARHITNNTLYYLSRTPILLLDWRTRSFEIQVFVLAPKKAFEVSSVALELLYSCMPRVAQLLTLYITLSFLTQLDQKKKK